MSTHMETQKGFEAGQTAEGRPEVVTGGHLDYLDYLRESGEINMFGARPYLMESFPDLTSGEASTILSYWMRSFGDPNR